MPLDHSIIGSIRAPRLADLTDSYDQGRENKRRSRLADLQADEYAAGKVEKAEDREWLKQDRTAAQASAKDAKLKTQEKESREAQERAVKRSKEIMADAIPYLRAMPDPKQRADLLRARFQREKLDASDWDDGQIADSDLDALEQGLIGPDKRAELSANAAKAKTQAEKDAADAKRQADALDETRRHNKAMEGIGFASANKPKAGEVSASEVVIPGLVPQHGVQLTKDSVKNVKAGAQAYDTIKEQIGRLRDLYHGKADPVTGDRKGGVGTEMGGETARQMASIMRQIQFTLKGPEFVNLGVLNGPDLALLDEMVANPTGFWNNAKAIVPGLGDPVEPSLKELENFIEGRFNSALKRNGFQRATGSPTPAAVSQPPAAGTTKQNSHGDPIRWNGQAWELINGG